MKTSVLHLESHQARVYSPLFRCSVLFWGIVLFALTLRIGFIAFLSPYMDASSTLSVDASSYHQIAQNLIEHHIFTSSLDPPYNPQLPSTFRPPLTPLYLAVIYNLFGVNLLWGRIGLAVISALSCGFTYMLGRTLFGQTTGILAGMISCGYPFFLLLVHLPLTEGFSVFLTLVLLTLFFSYQASVKEKPKRSYEFAWIAGIGIIFGLNLLNKASNIVVFPCLVFWSMCCISAPLKKRVIKLITVVIVAIAMILPWTIRNYRILGMFVPINSNGGWTFYLGNNPYTEKNLDALEQGRSNGWIPPQEVFVPFADVSFAETQIYEKRAVRLGMNFIRENPGKFGEFVFRKLRIFWSPYPHVLDKMSWYPIALLSVLGFYCSISWWKRHVLVYLLILSSMIIPIVFTSMPRFRAPIMPFLIIYGAFGIVRIGQKICESALMRE